MNLIRPSSLELVRACPAAARECADLPNVAGEAAMEGRWRHEAMALAVEKFRGDAENFVAEGADAIAIKYGLDVRLILDSIDDYADLLTDLIPDDRRVESEVSLGSALIPGLTGTIDILATSPDKTEAMVIDLKTGFLDTGEAESHLQTQAYAVLVAENNPKIERVETVILRAGKIGRPKTTRASATADWLKGPFATALGEIVEAAKDPDAGYMTGAHCENCPALTKCPAHHKQFLALTGATPEGALERLHDLSPSDQGRVVGMVKSGQKLLAALESELKRIAVEHPLPVGDGKVWGPVPTAGRREINPQLAWNAINYHVGNDRMQNVVAIKTGELERQAVLHTEESATDELKTGWKGKAKAALWSDLDACRAVSRKPGVRYEVHTPKKEIENE